MTDEEAIKVMTVLTAAYPDKVLQEQTITLYLEFLLDLPYQAGKAGALALIAKSKWFPSIAELRQQALSFTPESDVPNAADAWGEVIQQIRAEGWYGKPKFSHAAIEKTVRSIGWRELCMSENAAVDRAHFIKLYELYRDREATRTLLIPEAKRLLGELQGVVIPIESGRRSG